MPSRLIGPLAFAVLAFGLARSLPADPPKETWWSFRPLQAPAIPQTGAQHPIDAFILAKLREKNLSPAPAADRRTLIRRVTFDLIGLPPTPEEVAAFVNDPAADAYERLVDRLLA